MRTALRAGTLACLRKLQALMKFVSMRGKEGGNESKSSWSGGSAPAVYLVSKSVLCGLGWCSRNGYI